MTNAEKFLKDRVSAREFREKLAQFIFGELGFYDGTEGAIDEVIGDFLDMIEKPTLTEDERVILRNIDKKFKSIKRANDSYLYLVKEDNAFRDIRYEFEVFPNLFQFIKERRRIRNRGVVKMSGIFNWDYELVGNTDEIIELEKYYDKEIVIYKNNNNVVFRYDGAYRFELTFDEVETLNNIIKMTRKKRRKFVEEQRIQELLGGEK